MSQSEVIIDEQALIAVADSIISYTNNYREAIEDTVRKLELNSNDWNDEDFNMLLSAINSFMADIEEVSNGSNQLLQRIKNKIDAIHELHNMKI